MEEYGLPLVYAGLVPDVLVRYGIREKLSRMVAAQDAVPPYARIAVKQAYVADLRSRGLAEHTTAANEQHYEVPAAFYDLVMGRHKKYSCGLWPEGGAGACTLDESEAAALALVCERAQLTNTAGLRVLDMGCGWGSFSLYAAERFPLVAFTGVSNSASQRAYILAQAAARGLSNVTIVTADINAFEGAGKEFDRVVSIEMMEHVKNYQLLLRRVASWMRPGGMMFVHIFTHAHTPFHYVRGGYCCWLLLLLLLAAAMPLPSPPFFYSAQAPSSPLFSLPSLHTQTDGWMARAFFSGGQMPSDDLLLHFQEELALVNHWGVNGKHYERTCNEWLRKMDSKRDEALAVLAGVYGEENKHKRYVDWRLFFLACAELFGYKGGEEWAVSHYLFVKK
jgi:cyclopropane-fatty-acyl-phospholipid synthase